MFYVIFASLQTSRRAQKWNIGIDFSGFDYSISLDYLQKILESSSFIKMEFNSLTDDISLQVFRYLPLEDQVRLGRVDKNFSRISKMAISKTKSLDLSEDRFKQLI